MSGTNEAEQALLGCVLLGSHQTQDIFELVGPEDFLASAHGEIFAALRRLYRAGHEMDLVSVMEELSDREEGVSKDYLFDLQAATPAISRAMVYAGIVIKASRLRSFIHQLSDLTHRAGDDGADPDELHADLVSLTADRRLLPRGVEEPTNLSIFGDVLDLYDTMVGDDDDDWIIPDMLRRRWRALIIGGEGTGKSTILRTIAVAVANGFHPFVGPGSSVIPRRTLMVDAENPIDIIAGQLQLIDKWAHMPVSRHENAFVWRVEQGMDLRLRRDQAQFEEVLKRTRPDLVCLGPLYKLHRTKDDWEQAAMDVTGYLDVVRTRFEFALVLEHHIPNEGKNPLGSSVWKRWPEFGVRLSGENADAHGHFDQMKAVRFRGDRVMANWPTVLTKANSPSHGVPWVGTFESGVWTRKAKEVEPPPPPPPTDDDW